MKATPKKPTWIKFSKQRCSKIKTDPLFPQAGGSRGFFDQNVRSCQNRISAKLCRKKNAEDPHSSA